MLSDEMREYPDTESAVDEGGAVSVIHDLAARDVERGPFLFGRVLRGVHVRELAIITGGDEVKMLRDVANAMESDGERPCIKFHRDCDGRVDGLVLCSAIGEAREVA